MKKIFTSILLTLALLTLSVGAAFAQTTTTITGTVQSVTLGTDASGQTTVNVTLLDAQGVTQNLTISVATATSLGLVTTDAAGVTTVNSASIGTSVTINSSDVITQTTTDQNPVATALSNFFSGLIGVDYATIMSYHDDGVGFGVIAQALWMTNELGGDTSTFTALLDAKQSGDYSAITLADGSTPRNWGDVVKSLKHGDNLGSVMSGRADATTTGQTSGQTSPSSATGGQGRPDNPGNGHGKPDNPGGGHGKP